MTKPLERIEPRQKVRRGTRRAPAYRAVTLGNERDDWGVVDGRGDVLFRGDAKVAAMIANRLTRPPA